jgi:LPXTG-site transpeptidase (sortase) family protein
MATNGPATKAAARGIRAGQKAMTRKWSFLAVFALIFFTSYSTLVALDLVPEPSADGDTAATTLTASAVQAVVAAPELPTKIEIPSIKLSVSVANPTSTNVEVLDNALLKGAVRYPSSSKLGEAGNVIIFGHSSYLPIVNNPAFKAFDGIQDLKEGDRITVTGSGHTYTYAVESVVKADADADAIPLNVEGSKLTLATCNSFGTKSGRFVVTANLVESDLVGA